MSTSFGTAEKSSTSSTSGESTSDIGTTLQNYGNQIRDYLSHINANVEEYRFRVEKQEDELLIDVAFKARIGMGGGMGGGTTGSTGSRVSTSGSTMTE